MSSRDSLMFNPQPVSSWTPSTPAVATTASPYGDLPSQGTFSPSAPTSFGPNSPQFDPYTNPGQPYANMGTTYNDAYSGQPTLDPRATNRMNQMGQDEKDRQEARCPTCVAAKKKRKEDNARANSCGAHVAALGGAAAVGGLSGGPWTAAGVGAVGGAAGWATSVDCWDGVHDPLQALTGVK